MTAVLTGVFRGATGEAGAAAIRALARLVRRTPDLDADTVASELLEAPDRADLDALAQRLIEAAEQDQLFAAELHTWVAEVGGGALVDDSTSNAIDGTVHGPVVQGRDFSGPIHLNQRR